MSHVKLRQQEYLCLCEALRRFDRFHKYLGALLDAWTGLGTPHYYKQAQQGGYMEPIGREQLLPRIPAWWKLTPSGACIVAYWLGQGFNSDKIEANLLPPQSLPWPLSSVTNKKREAKS